MRFDNGARIVRLMTLEALKYEGSSMGNCIGSGSYDEAFLSGEEVFYSLRDTQNKPHATMEVGVGGNILRQCKGKENKPPVEKYMPMLQAFLTEQKFILNESAAYCGLVQGDEGQYYSISKLPDGLSVSRDLDLSSCTLAQLPKGLSVGGHLNLIGCTSLTQLPEDLSVGGSLNLFACTSLTQLPEGLSIGKSLNLYCCTALTSIPRTIKVVGRISTDLGVFETVSKAADAFDQKYPPRHPATPRIKQLSCG